MTSCIVYAYFTDGPSSNTMQYIQIPVVRESECQRAFATFKTAVIDERVVCAGFLRGGKDACKVCVCARTEIKQKNAGFISGCE